MCLEANASELERGFSHKFCFSLGGLEIDIFVKGTIDVTSFLERWGPYMSEGASQHPAATLTVDYTPDIEYVISAPRPVRSSPVAAMGIPIQESFLSTLTRGEGGRVLVTSCVYEMEYDGKAAAHGIVWLPDFVRGFEGVVCSFLSEFLLLHNRVFLHSSGILFGEQALLFSGRSGAGKTTAIWQLEHEHTVLSDELILLEWSPEEPTRFVAHGTPFFGAWNKLGAPVSAPLHCIHFLRKTPQNELHALSPKDAFRYATQVICFREPSPSLTQQLLDVAERLVPYCRLLGFRPTTELWGFLSQPAHFSKGLSR
jgi:hypothetical protein